MVLSCFFASPSTSFLSFPLPCFVFRRQASLQPGFVSRRVECNNALRRIKFVPFNSFDRAETRRGWKEEGRWKASPVGWKWPVAFLNCYSSFEDPLTHDSHVCRKDVSSGVAKFQRFFNWPRKKKRINLSKSKILPTMKIYWKESYFCNYVHIIARQSSKGIKGRGYSIHHLSNVRSI